ncbi:MAG: hypothetical protein ABEH81_04795 [Halopenitus sp.]
MVGDTDENAQGGGRVDSALFGRRDDLFRGALILTGILFVAAAVVAMQLGTVYAVDRLSRPLVWQTGALGLILLTAINAYLNEGVMVCWLLAFGPILGATLGLAGIVFSAGGSGLIPAIAASVMGAGTLAILFGGVGFLIGMSLRTLRH